MNARQTYRVALLLLAMLLSHEGITLANNVRQAKALRSNAELHDSLKDMTALMDLGELGSSSFLETENRQGMSVEAYATFEMKAIHKSLKEGFEFENSPILEDLKTLTPIPNGRVLTETELRSHRASVSSLLEKAMTGMHAHLASRWVHAHLASHAGQSVTSGGNCVKKKTVSWHSTCSKASECRSDPDDPCRGDCVCDTSGVNECTCKTPDTGSVLHKSKEIDKALRLKRTSPTDVVMSENMEKSVNESLSGGDMLGSAIFGFFDGFTSGMLSMLRESFNDPKCTWNNQAPGSCFENGNEDMKSVFHSFRKLWKTLKDVHKLVWTKDGRKELKGAVKTLMRDLVYLLKKAMRFIWDCPGTKKILILVGVVVALLLLNIAFLLSGLVVIPLIIKYAGMLMGLYFSFGYMKDKIVSLIKRFTKFTNGHCRKTCRKGLIEDSFAIAGVVMEVILLSGIDKVLEFKRGKGLFKRFGVSWHDSFKKDMKILADATKDARNKIFKPEFYKKFKTNADDVLPKQNDYQKYLEAKKKSKAAKVRKDEMIIEAEYWQHERMKADKARWKIYDTDVPDNGHTWDSRLPFEKQSRQTQFINDPAWKLADDNLYYSKLGEEHAIGQVDHYSRKLFEAQLLLAKNSGKLATAVAASHVIWLQMLSGTKYTFKHKKNILAKKRGDVNGGLPDFICEVLSKKECNNDKIRYCTKRSNNDESFVETSSKLKKKKKFKGWGDVEGTCNRMSAAKVFRGLSSECDQKVTFDCQSNRNLCDCLEWVAESNSEVMFKRGKESLKLMSDGAYVYHDFKCDGNRRRRRLLQMSGTGTC